MNMRRLIIFVVLILSFQMVGFSALEDWALSVDIQPDTPTIYDPIDIISNGIRSSGAVVKKI